MDDFGCVERMKLSLILWARVVFSQNMGMQIRFKNYKVLILARDKALTSMLFNFSAKWNKLFESGDSCKKHRSDGGKRKAAWSDKKLDQLGYLMCVRKVAVPNMNGGN